ncbi:MAG: hypothetical protein NZ585_05070 [Chloracidobacterium sp.]|nr:hypothetical protein [Chloracidobacterium sp.]MDW8216673.1 hypothetical protein [Acidobacteriota bacterium]
MVRHRSFTTACLGLALAAGVMVSTGCTSEEKKPAAPPPAQQQPPPPPPPPEPPKPSPEDIQLKSAVEAALMKEKFTSVAVTVLNGEVTVKGTVPKGKKAAALAAVGSAKPKKVNSAELVEQ